jgi:hypothetical protein
VHHRLSAVLAATALVVALLGTTSLGRAAGHELAAIVPLAKRANYAKRAGFAVNAGKLSGHRASVNPRAGQIPVLDALGKLPAALGVTGPAGPQGPTGAQGPAGPKGDTGPAGTFDASKLHLKTFSSVLVPAASFGGSAYSCDSGQVALSGGINSGYRWEVESLYPESTTTWSIRVFNPTGSSQVFQPFLLCADA